MYIVKTVICIQHTLIIDYQERLFPANQSAYRRFHSTETAFLSTSIRYCYGIKDWKNNVISLLDTSEAFDTVDHALLLSKLEQCYGICEKVYDLISSYLKDRSQTVHYQSSNSSRRVLKYGVPQGSVLGPVLFLHYTGEINHVIEQYSLRSQCYADYCQVHSSCQPDKKDEFIKSTLICIEGFSLWMASNRLGS